MTSFRPCFLSRLLNVHPLKFIILYASSAANFWFVVVPVTRNDLLRFGVAYQSSEGGGGAQDYAA